MAQNLLASLSLAGVVQRTRDRFLRVAPRFLAHAEGTAGRFRTVGIDAEEVEILANALRTWDDYHHDPYAGATILHRLMADRDQLGAIRPVFPTLERFAVAA